MASILKHLRSSTANKRPTASGLSDGQIAINTASGTPALFFKDNADNIVKVGPVHVGATAPNTSPAGSAGNSTGELWVDDGLTTKGLKYYSGTAFVNLTPSGTTSESGLVELATNAETQTGSDAVRAVTPAGLQSKVSDSTSTISSTTIASATAVKSAYDLANAALPKTGGTVTGEIVISPSGSLAFEGSTDDSFETRIVVTDPTADRTITLPNITGTVITTGDTGTVTSTMIADGTIVNADINASAAIAPSKLGSGALPNGVTVSSTNIVDGTIVNADVNASAAIAGSKISPDFAGQNVVTTGSITGASLIPSSATVPTNGVYLPAANNVAISTNGTGRLFVDSSGKVGIGTASPTGTLQIQPANSDIPASALVVRQNNGADTSQNTFSIEIDPVNNVSRLISTGTTSPQISFYTGASERLRITSDGKLGLGTSSPGSKLEVKGDSNNSRVHILNTDVGASSFDGSGPGLLLTAAGMNTSSKFTPGILFGSTDSDFTTTNPKVLAAINGIAGQTYATDTAGGMELAFYTTPDNQSTGNDVQERLRIDKNGNVGVGTSSPDATLNVRAGANNTTAEEIASFSRPDAAVRAAISKGLISGTTNGIAIGTTTNHPFAINTNGTERFYITNAGNVGVGTTSPVGRLDVATAGDSSIVLANETTYTDGIKRGRITKKSDNSLVIQACDSASAVDTVFLRTISAESARIDSSGRLLVGTSSARANLFNSTITSAFQLEGAGIAPAQRFASVINNYATNGDGGAVIVLGRSKGGTLNSNALVGSAAGDQLGRLDFQGNDGTEFVSGASIEAWTDGTCGANDLPSRLVFSTTADGASSPTERMRITQSGDVLIAKTTTDTNTQGIRFSSLGVGAFARDGDIPLFVNRNTNDGGLVVFRQDGTDEGSISVSGTTVSYNGAHLSRWSQLPSGIERVEILRGTVLSNIDEMCEWGDEDNEQLNRMKVSDVEGDKNVSGVFQAWDDDDDTYTNDLYCAMTGDFIIRIGAGVTVERGDLLMSAGDGTAKPQDDDIIRSKTIAKVTSTNVSCTYDDGSYCVPCVLMAC